MKMPIVFIVVTLIKNFTCFTLVRFICGVYLICAMRIMNPAINGIRWGEIFFFHYKYKL